MNLDAALPTDWQNLGLKNLIIHNSIAQDSAKYSSTKGSVASDNAVILGTRSRR